MIYFTLPNFYENFTINNFFIELKQNFSNFFKIQFAFVSETGNFPYNYWNGGYNTNQGPGCTYPTIYDCNKDTTLPLRLNCSNIFLDRNDFEDNVANTILDICHDSSNQIEISNLDFYLYLKDKYPKYNFIFSKQADLIHPFSIDTINQLNEKGYFYLISLPKKLSLNLNFLKQLKNKSHIELTVNTLCDLNCPNLINCQKESHINQYNYSEINPYNICLIRKECHKIAPLITVEDIHNIYQPLGFCNFSIEDFANSKRDNLFIFLLDYFIKDEYKLTVYNMAFERGLLI